MGTGKSKTKARSLLTFWIGILAFSALAFAELPVIYPFDKSGSAVIARPYFEKSFLDYLREVSIFPILDEGGSPAFYYSADCASGCTNISINNYTFGSSTFAKSETGLSAVVIGHPNFSDSINSINFLRLSLGSKALADMERSLLAEQFPFRQEYYDARYTDVWDYAIDAIKKNSTVYSELTERIRAKDYAAAAEALKKYLDENFETNALYDALNLYDALDKGRIGPIQYNELMENVLRNLDVPEAELESLLKGLESEQFREALKKAMEAAEKDENLKRLAKEILNNKELMDSLMKELVKNNALKEFFDLFMKLENKDEIIRSIMRASTEYMRELVSEGKMDDISKSLEGEFKEIAESLANSFGRSILDTIGDWGSSASRELAYVLTAVALAVMAIILFKMRI